MNLLNSQTRDKSTSTFDHSCLTWIADFVPGFFSPNMFYLWSHANKIKTKAISEPHLQMITSA